jgi:hypothetical protein
MKRLKLISSLLLSLVCLSSSFAQVANWTPVPAGTIFPTNLVGQINGMARITQMKFHVSNPQKFYAVTSQGGLFTSNNAGTSWTVAPGTETMVVNASGVCVDYTNDQNIWLATGDPNYYSNGQGIYYSTNGGQSFVATSLSNCLVIDILQNPINASQLVAATNKGIYKSINAGATWAAVTATTLAFCDLKSNAAVNSQTLFACTNEVLSKFFRSTDFGTTWSQITTGIVTPTANTQSGARIGVTPSSTNVVYFELISDGGMVHKSNNGGLSFNLKKAGGSPYLTYYSNTVTAGGQGNYNNAIAVDVNNPANVWLQAHNTWFSADSGATWTMRSYWPFNVHTDMHQIMQSPYNANDLYSCNDGGVWLSNDGGTNWVTKTDGIFAFEIGNETAVSSQIQPKFVSIGTQDNARLYGNATAWYTISGGDDYAKRVFDYNGHLYIDGLNRQLNHTGATAAYNLPTANWNYFAFNRTNTDLAFMGYNQIYRSVNVGASSPSWTLVSALSNSVAVLHSCIANTNRLYGLTTNGNFFVTNNALAANPSYTIVALAGGNTAIGSIQAMAGNADIVYVHKNNSVYRSQDGGLSFTNVTFNLPNVNHRRLLAEQYGGTQELVLLATNNAVYYKKAGQTSWTIYSSGLPPRKAPSGFSMFDDGTTQARIRYASYGRGMWESGFENLRELNANIIFVSDTVITCSSGSVQVRDGSVGAINTPLTYTWNFPGGSPATAFTSSAAVVYTASGNYSMTLTIRDALNNVSSKSTVKFIQVISCAADTVPGSCLQANGTTNYASTSGGLGIGTTNSITLAGWIKIDQVQASFAGIIFSGNGGATGLNFRNGNQLGYHYNNGAATYNYGGGPIVPLGEWVHVAMVTTSGNTILYMNGVPYTSNVSNPPISFAGGFTIGNDRDNSSRTMNGQLDEICIYNRSLSQNEIRELMHLTKNYGVIDAGLVAYYQFNEVGNVIYNRAGTTNAILMGSAQHTLSTAPVGSGSSMRQNINSTGLKLFPTQGGLYVFPGPGLPMGEICVTRLHLQPDSVPFNNFPNAAARYWVMNNYGNQGFNPISTMSLTGYGTITPAEATLPGKFKLYSRATGGYLKNSWVLIDSASAATSGTNAALTFTGSVVSALNKQFTIMKSACVPSSLYGIAATSTFICAGNTSSLTLSQANLNNAGNWFWSAGTCNSATIAAGNSLVVSPSVTTTYYVKGDGGCLAPNTSTCAAITISVNTGLQIPVSPVVSNTAGPVCQGTSKIYSVSNGSGVSSFNWTLPAGWTGSSTNASITVAPLSSGIMSVTASNMCGSSAVTTVAVVMNASISAQQSKTICAGARLQVGALTYSSSGTYTTRLQRSNGCDSVVTSNLFVEPVINTSVSINQLDFIADQSGATYQWIDCDTKQAISGATTQTYSANQDGNYAVIITVNNCADTSACMQMVEVGIGKNGSRSSIIIHPNPAHDLLYVQVPDDGYSYTLRDALGRLVAEGLLQNGNNTLNLEDFSKGVYQLQLLQQKEKRQISRKVIID